MPGPHSRWSDLRESGLSPPRMTAVLGPRERKEVASQVTEERKKIEPAQWGPLRRR